MATTRSLVLITYPMFGEAECSQGRRWLLTATSCVLYSEHYMRREGTPVSTPSVHWSNLFTKLLTTDQNRTRESPRWRTRLANMHDVLLASVQQWPSTIMNAARRRRDSSDCCKHDCDLRTKINHVTTLHSIHAPGFRRPGTNLVHGVLSAARWRLKAALPRLWPSVRGCPVASTL